MHSHSPALMRIRNCLKFKCAEHLEIFSYYCCKPFSVWIVGQKGLLDSSMISCAEWLSKQSKCAPPSEGSRCLLRSLCSGGILHGSATQPLPLPYLWIFSNCSKTTISERLLNARKSWVNRQSAKFLSIYKQHFRTNQIYGTLHWQL